MYQQYTDGSMRAFYLDRYMQEIAFWGGVMKLSKPGYQALKKPTNRKRIMKSLIEYCTQQKPSKSTKVSILGFALTTSDINDITASMYQKFGIKSDIDSLNMIYMVLNDYEAWRLDNQISDAHKVNFICLGEHIALRYMLNEHRKKLSQHSTSMSLSLIEQKIYKAYVSSQAKNYCKHFGIGKINFEKLISILHLNVTEFEQGGFSAAEELSLIAIAMHIAKTEERFGLLRTR